MDIEEDQKTPGKPTEDFSEAEAIVAGGRDDESKKEDKVSGSVPGTINPDNEALKQASKRKARSIVGMLESFFQVFHKDLNYSEEIFQKGEDRLAPVIAKHALTEHGVIKYSEEANALGFLGKLTWDSFSALGDMLEAEAEQAQGKKPAAKTEPPVQTQAGDPDQEEQAEVKSRYKDLD